MVRERTSCRGFLPDQVPSDILNSVLEEASLAPSNCNTQPWETHVVSGDKLKQLSEAILKADEAGNMSPDFSFDAAEFYGRYDERRFDQGKALYEAFSVKRENKEGRKEVSNQNYKFYNAPHLAIPFMPSFGDNVRVGGDIGMYGQNFLLSLTAHGLAGVPQTAVGFFADTVREILNVPKELRMLFGISFGYADPSAPGNSYKLGRDPIFRTVVFHQ
ncbi:nitroreductase [Flavobacterium sp. ARAG 55.4]|uniref:nitroreductase n=1 Tax=Flavobacterium sp. ARAG 55.4 TaxID=3451357 RepID=UPI003F470063